MPKLVVSGNGLIVVDVLDGGRRAAPMSIDHLLSLHRMNFDNVSTDGCGTACVHPHLRNL